ncbi:NAD-binding protein [candidate division WOR-3 bacterium]|nr:NAD-binding protein [candidate division WOR-3 bacterium]
MKVLIIGGGKLAYFLSRALIKRRNQVTIVNRTLDECRTLAKRLEVTVVHGDGSDPQILEEAGASYMNAVFAITPNDEDNLVICQLADFQFHVQRRLALVNDPDNEEIFQKLGVQAISTTPILSALIEEKAGLESITNIIPVGEGKIILTEIVVRRSSPVVGKALRDIKLPENSLIASVVHKNRPLVPRGSTVLHVKDKIIVMTLPENHGQVIKILTGERI